MNIDMISISHWGMFPTTPAVSPSRPYGPGSAGGSGEHYVRCRCIDPECRERLLKAARP